MCFLVFNEWWQGSPRLFPQLSIFLHLLWCYQGSIRNRSKLSSRVTVSLSDTQQFILNTQCLKNAGLKATYGKVLNRWSIRQDVSNFQKFPKNSYQKCHIFHCFAFGFSVANRGQFLSHSGLSTASIARLQGFESQIHHFLAMWHWQVI